MTAEIRGYAVGALLGALVLSAAAFGTALTHLDDDLALPMLALSGLIIVASAVGLFYATSETEETP
jgi:hypothetical protein